MDGSDNLLAIAWAVFPAIFAHDFLRYTIIVGLVFLCVNVLFAKSLRSRMIRPRDIPKGQIRREILTSFRTILVFTSIGMCIWLGVHFGVLKFYESIESRGWPWFWISVVVLIVLHDTWFYWTHRLIHHRRLFRHIHKTHHKSRVPTPFTAYAFDLPEAIINGVYVLCIGAIMPISFLAMLIFTVHMTLRNAIGHSGYELFPSTRTGRPYCDWLTTVTHHDMHHEYANAGNFGLYFTFWDRVMGTEQKNYHKRFAKSQAAN